MLLYKIHVVRIISYFIHMAQGSHLYLTFPTTITLDNYCTDASL